MAMTNAERQRRWRERLKAKAAAADGAPDVDPEELEELRALRRVLEEQYVSAGEAIIKGAFRGEPISDDAKAALRRFRAAPPTPARLASAAMAAGERHAVECWKAVQAKQMEEARKEPVTNEPKKPRRRRSKTA